MPGMFWWALVLLILSIGLLIASKRTSRQRYAQALVARQNRLGTSNIRQGARPASDYDNPAGAAHRAAQPEPKPEPEDYSARLTTIMWSLCGVGLVCLLVSLGMFGSLNYIKVPAKNIGIGTDFGRPVAQYDNGPHSKPFWREVHMMDGAIQVDKHEQDAKSTGCDQGVKIRLGNQSLACANIIVNWQINQGSDKVVDLYKNYKDTGTVGDKVVNPALNSVANAVFSGYDPLQNLDTNGKPMLSLETISGSIKDKLQVSLGSDVNVKKVNVTLVDYDKQTEDKINAFQAALADTRIAEQKKETAKQEAAANETINKSLKDPSLVDYLCIDVERDMVKKGMTPPAAHCGSGSGVLVDGTSKK